MKHAESIFGRWGCGLTIFALLFGLCLPHPANLCAQEPALPPKAPPQNAPRQWQWKTGDEVFQLVVVEKHSKFSVQGLPLESKVRYKLLSRLSMRVSPLDGSLTIKQKIETTRLDEADELSKGILTAMLKDLTGRTISIRVNADGEIASIEGLPEEAAGQAAVGNGLNVNTAVFTSLIDRDGWKELTRATLFTPQKPLAEGTSWEEAMSHSWGDLGSWQGQTTYEYKGPGEGLHAIGYTHDLIYHPPLAEGRNNLPFKISNPAFRTKAAHGTLRFDADKGRLSSMEENFHVQGRMMIDIAGQSLPMQLDETQDFQLELLDKKPAPDYRPMPAAKK